MTSHADGSFVLARNEPGTVDQSFLATADGGLRQGIVRLDGPSGYRGPRTLVRIVLRPAREVTVTVVDGHGAPVPDAVVVALDRYFPVAEMHTDARGLAVLRVPADANMQWIVGAKRGVGFDYFENDRSGWLTPWARPPRSARLVLDGARTVRIRAVDSAGRPVPGVELATSMIRKKGKLGAIHFARLPHQSPHGREWRRDVRLAAGRPDGPTRRSTRPRRRTSCRSGLPGRRQARGRADGPGPASDAGLGQGDLPRRLARAGHPGPGPRLGRPPVAGFAHSARARTADDGSYAMDLPPEHSYMIGVTDDEWAAPSLAGIVVREGVARAGLDLTLERGSVVRGRVTFEPDSKPAPGRTVRLVEQGPAIPAGLFPARFAGTPRGADPVRRDR